MTNVPQNEHENDDRISNHHPITAGQTSRSWRSSSAFSRHAFSHHPSCILAVHVHLVATHTWIVEEMMRTRSIACVGEHNFCHLKTWRYLDSDLTASAATALATATSSSETSAFFRHDFMCWKLFDKLSVVREKEQLDDMMVVSSRDQLEEVIKTYSGAGRLILWRLPSWLHLAPRSLGGRKHTVGDEIMYVCPSPVPYLPPLLGDIYQSRRRNLRTYYLT